MKFKEITIVLLTMCAAENQILFLKQASALAISPSRFYREDVPMSFKYGYVHHYSTPSPILRPGQPGQHIQNFYPGIQYAPLQGRLGQKNKNAAAEYTKVTPTLSSAPTIPTEPLLQGRKKNALAKNHLEPRVQPGPEVRDPAYKCYNPGRNVAVLSSVSRSPGHNAVYRSFPDPVQRDKSFKINYMRPYGVYQNLETITTTMLPFELPRDNPAAFAFTNQHYVINPNLVNNEGQGADKIKRQYSPYPKFHRLHLNIARVYSPGQVPQKSPVFADTYSLNVGGLPVHTQAYLPPIFQALADRKTPLYPSKETQKKYLYRFP